MSPIVAVGGTIAIGTVGETVMRELHIAVSATIGILEGITVETNRDVEIFHAAETIQTAGDTGETTLSVGMTLTVGVTDAITRTAAVIRFVEMTPVVIQVAAMIVAGTMIEASPGGGAMAMTGPVGPTAATGETTATGVKAVAAIGETVGTSAVAVIGMSPIGEGHKPVEATVTTAWATLAKMKWTQSSI